MAWVEGSRRLALYALAPQGSSTGPSFRVALSLLLTARWVFTRCRFPRGSPQEGGSPEPQKLHGITFCHSQPLLIRERGEETPMSRWEDDRESATIFNPHTRAREWRAYWWPRRRIGHRSQLSTVFPMTGLSTAAPPPPPRAEGNCPHHHGRLGHVTCFSR